VATVTNVMVVLSVEEKVRTIQQIENGQKRTDLCQEFGLVNSTIQTIWKNWTKIISASEENGSRKKAILKAYLKWRRWGAA